jgi:hypothetical protein
VGASIAITLIPTTAAGAMATNLRAFFHGIANTSVVVGKNKNEPRFPLCWEQPTHLNENRAAVGGCGGSRPIQREQAAQYFFIAEVHRPAVGGGHRVIQRLMGVNQPGRALVVEVGQGALFRSAA